MGLPAIPSPTIGATTGVGPAASGFMPPSTGFVFRSKTRPSTPTESSSRRLSIRTACVTDWSFSFRCSPPRIAATQLRFDTARLFTAQKRTSTALSIGLDRATNPRMRCGGTRSLEAGASIRKIAKRQRIGVRCLWGFWALFRQLLERVIAHILDDPDVIWGSWEQTVAFPKTQRPCANSQYSSCFRLPNACGKPFLLEMLAEDRRLF